jgi:hypothetical protein
VTDPHTRRPRQDQRKGQYKHHADGVRDASEAPARPRHVEPSQPAQAARPGVGALSVAANDTHCDLARPPKVRRQGALTFARVALYGKRSERRTPSALAASSLWVERQPDGVGLFQL